MRKEGLVTEKKSKRIRAGAKAIILAKKIKTAIFIALFISLGIEISIISEKIANLILSLDKTTLKIIIFAIIFGFAMFQIATIKDEFKKTDLNSEG